MSYKTGDTVTIHYVGKLEDGTEFDSSEGLEPLEFVIGSEELMPKFENALIGKKTGDIVEIALEPEDAFGLRDEDFIYEVEKDMFDDVDSLEVGMILTQDSDDEDEEGEMPVQATILEILDKTVRIDENHPLAGKKVFFTVTVQ